MQRIYVVRHGQTNDNAHKIVSGSRETALSHLGITQAHHAGKHAKGLGIDLIVASPLGRAQQTAKIIAQEIGYPPEAIVTINDLAERNLGDLEGTSYAHNEKLNGNFPAVDHILGVEKLVPFHNRVQDVLRGLLRDSSHHTILVVCHIGVGRMLRTVAEGKSSRHMYDQPRLENAAIYPLIA